MKIIKPSYEIMNEISEGGIKELQLIERIGRTCYKSEDKITEDGESAKKFVKMLIDKEHGAMIEHSFLSVKFTVDRGVSHELVRHRLASFAQESTRYCNYSQDKFGSELTVIDPYFWKKDSDEYRDWEYSVATTERCYMDLLGHGAAPQEARSVLPNSLKTEITISTNYREWRTIFKLRTANAAHPQMREIMRPLLDDLKTRIPIVFDDITYEGENE